MIKEALIKCVICSLLRKPNIFVITIFSVGKLHNYALSNDIDSTLYIMCIFNVATVNSQLKVCSHHLRV